MKWHRDLSVAESFQRRYKEWHPRFAWLQHRCGNSRCRATMWCEDMLSILHGGYDGPYRMWACSHDCARVIGDRI